MVRFETRSPDWVRIAAEVGRAPGKRTEKCGVAVCCSDGRAAGPTDGGCETEIFY